MGKLIKIVFIFLTLFFEKNLKAQEIELRILKDTIVNNSIVMVEFYNNSNEAYCFPFDISMDRHLINNGTTEWWKNNISLTYGKFTLKEVYLDKNRNICRQMVEETTCDGGINYWTGGSVLKKEISSTNINMLFLIPNSYIKIPIPIQIVKDFYFKSFKMYPECVNSNVFLQFTYQISSDDLDLLRVLNPSDEIYTNLSFGDINYKIYTKEIKSNIVPIKR